MDAAKRIFERDGFLESRIVDIAEEADIAPGTFYHYFDSKEEVFREVAEMYRGPAGRRSRSSVAG